MFKNLPTDKEKDITDIVKDKTPEQINPGFINSKSKTRIPRMENMDQNLQFHNPIPLHKGLPLYLCQTFHRVLLSTGSIYIVWFPGQQFSSACSSKAVISITCQKNLAIHRRTWKYFFNMWLFPLSSEKNMGNWNILLLKFREFAF